MRESWDIEDNISACKDDIDKIASMTEEEVCDKWNVDLRSEIIGIINEELAELEKELKAAIEKEDAEWGEWYRDELDDMARDEKRLNELNKCA